MVGSSLPTTETIMNMQCLHFYPNETRRPGGARPNWKSPHPPIFISHTPQFPKTVIRPSHFKPCSAKSAISSHIQPFQPFLAISRHFQPFPVISSHFKVYPAKLFWASFLVCGWSVINGAYPVQYLPFGRDGVTITSLSSIHLLRTTLALYEKKPP